MFKKILLSAGSIAIMTATTFGGAMAADPENTLVVQLSNGGPVTIELANDVAPNHAARLKELARAGFYDGLKFHRVIPGFMAQTGDPTGTGTSGSDKPDLAAEFSQKDYKRGTVGMARKSDPNSANSQFFICFDDTGCASLKGQYTVVGQVTSGMEFIDKVAAGEPPATPDTMVKVQVQADAEKPAAAAADAAAPADAAPAAAPAAEAETTPAAGETAPAPAETPAAETPAADAPAAH
jgi:peptidylprolyl isomerase